MKPCVAKWASEHPDLVRKRLIGVSHIGVVLVWS
jgi:hypothetical protein